MDYSGCCAGGPPFLSVGNFGCFWMLTRLLYQWYNVTIITWMLCWISVWPDIRHPPCKQVTVNIEYARSNAMPTNMNQYANMRSHFFCHYNNCEQNNLTEKKTILSFFFYIYQDSQKFKYYFNHVEEISQKRIVHRNGFLG